MAGQAVALAAIEGELLAFGRADCACAVPVEAKAPITSASVSAGSFAGCVRE
jgi:hypothetical protein